MNLPTGPPSFVLEQLALSTGKSVCSTLCILPLLFVFGMAKQVSDSSSLFLSEMVTPHKKETQVVGEPGDCKVVQNNSPLLL